MDCGFQSVVLLEMVVQVLCVRCSCSTPHAVVDQSFGLLFRCLVCAARTALVGEDSDHAPA